jgi:hypothetical protein
LKKIVDCNTRSVTPTSELADRQVDIDEEFAAKDVARKLKKFSKTTSRMTKVVHKRA